MCNICARWSRVHCAIPSQIPFKVYGDTVHILLLAVPQRFPFLWLCDDPLLYPLRWPNFSIPMPGLIADIMKSIAHGISSCLPAWA